MAHVGGGAHRLPLRPRGHRGRLLLPSRRQRAAPARPAGHRLRTPGQHRRRADHLRLPGRTVAAGQPGRRHRTAPDRAAAGRPAHRPAAPAGQRRELAGRGRSRPHRARQRRGVPRHAALGDPPGGPGPCPVGHPGRAGPAAPGLPARRGRARAVGDRRRGGRRARPSGRRAGPGCAGTAAAGGRAARPGAGPGRGAGRQPGRGGDPQRAGAADRAVRRQRARTGPQRDGRGRRAGLLAGLPLAGVVARGDRTAAAAEDRGSGGAQRGGGHPAAVP